MTDETEKWSPREAWIRFRLEAEAAKNYHLSYAMYLGQTHRHVLLDEILPSLLYVKAVTILDDALALWLDDNGHHLAKPKVTCTMLLCRVITSIWISASSGSIDGAMTALRMGPPKDLPTLNARP